MMKIIDPAELSVDDALKLHQWFKSQNDAQIYYWDKGTTYLFADGTEFQLAHKVVQRKRNKNNAEIRYEFISDSKLGSGNYGVVFEISGTLTLEPPTLVKYKPAGSKGKTRVVKISQITNKHPVSKVMTEYKFSKLAPHLAVKYPIINGNSSYLVMRKMKGRSLYNIIVEDFKEINYLTLQQRIDLTIALLHMLQDQATNKKLIHRDVKPENIYVDLSEPIFAQLFDYELSREVDHDDGICPGSYEYAAPEQFTTNPISVRTDVFALGRVLALIWRVSGESYTYETPKQYMANAKNINLSTLFRDIPDISEVQKTIIKETLTLMMKPKQNDRIYIEEAISRFEKLNQATPQKEIPTQPTFFQPPPQVSNIENEEKSAMLAGNNERNNYCSIV